MSRARRSPIARALRSACSASIVFVACACSNLHTASETVREPPPPAGDEIVVCGERFHIGAPVVLWTEGPRYDASSTAPRFGTAPAGEKAPEGLRYQPGRARKQADGTLAVAVEPHSRDLDRLREVVDQFVLHFDVCGVSSTCFRVLQDERGLSVHFLLDIDGTLYQTLDLRDQAFHATKANPRSIGIEIANIGAYPPGQAQPLAAWYMHDTAGPYIFVPERLNGGGVRTSGFVGRPACSELVRGRIQGDELVQYDFTREQYASLEKLAAALCTIFPKIEADAPRDENGLVIESALSDARFSAFHGILGHYHVQANKNDPGPAFDWEKFLARVRELLGAKVSAP